jgi:hypothetical protein
VIQFSDQGYHGNETFKIQTSNLVLEITFIIQKAYISGQLLKGEGDALHF